MRSFSSPCNLAHLDFRYYPAPIGYVSELRTFVRIVGAGSLSAAGREMGLALSVVSKRLAMLERRTEMRHIARSTRRLALTEEGETLYDRALRILAEIDEAEAALTHGRVEPQGVLRVSAPMALGRAHAVRSAAILFGHIRDLNRSRAD